MANLTVLFTAAEHGFEGFLLSGSVLDQPFSFVRQEIARNLPKTTVILGEGRQKMTGDLVPVYDGKRKLTPPNCLSLIAYTENSTEHVGKGLKEALGKQGVSVLSINLGENAVELKLPLDGRALVEGKKLADMLMNVKGNEEETSGEKKLILAPSLATEALAMQMPPGAAKPI